MEDEEEEEEVGDKDEKSGCHCMHFYCGEMVAPVQVHCNGWAEWVHIIK